MENEKTMLPVIHMQGLKGTVAEANSIATKMVQAVLDGDLNPLDFAVKKKVIEQALQAAADNKDVKKAIIDEAQKSPGGKLTHLQSSIEVKETGVKYNFDNCGHKPYVELMKRKAELDKEIKDMETFLKAIPASGLQQLDEDGGEIFIIYPPTKSSTTSATISLQKPEK